MVDAFLVVSSVVEGVVVVVEVVVVVVVVTVLGVSGAQSNQKLIMFLFSIG